MTMDHDGRRVMNEECQSLPGCPLCGGLLTNLEVYEVKRADGSGGWRATVLRCVSRPPLPDRPACSFLVPMAFTRAGWG